MLPPNNLKLNSNYSPFPLRTAKTTTTPYRLILIFTTTLLCTQFQPIKADIVSNETFPFISDQLDEFFSSLGVPIFNILAITAIALGLFVAFFGPKGQGPKLVGFIAGALIGCFLGAVILEAIDKSQEVGNAVWVSVFLGFGLVVGALCGCVMSFARVVLGIAMGLTVMGFVLQTGIGETIGNNGVILALVIISCIVGVLIAWKVIDFVYAVLSAVLGGIFVVLGVGYYTESSITLNGLVSDPGSAASCVEDSCYIPLALGGSVTLLALVYNIIGFRSRRKQAKKQKEILQESGDLVGKMKTEREAFETRLKELEKKNEDLLREMDARAEERENRFVGSLNDKLTKKEEIHNEELRKIQKQLEEQQAITLLAQKQALEQQEALKQEISKQRDDTNQERNILEATLQREREKDEKLKLAEKEKEALLNELENEKSELQLEIEREKLLQMQREADLAKEGIMDKKQKEKEQEENEATRKATLLSLQQEIAQSKIKIQDFDEDFKEATRLEKRLKLKLPPSMQKRKGSFVFSDLYFDEQELQGEEFREMKIRAEEFTKMKALVTKTKAGQRTTLKNLKKALNEVEKMGNQLRNYSKLNVLTDSPEVVRKEKESGLEEMTVKMTTFRTLLEKYEAINTSFTQLLSDMQESLAEFRRMEKRIEAYSKLNADNIDNLPTGVPVENLGATTGDAASARTSLNSKRNSYAKADAAPTVTVTVLDPDSTADQEAEDVATGPGDDNTFTVDVNNQIIDVRNNQPLDVGEENAEDLVGNLNDAEANAERDLENQRRENMNATPNAGLNIPANQILLGNAVPLRRVHREDYYDENDPEPLRPSVTDLNEELAKYLKFKAKKLMAKFRNPFRRN